MSRISMLEADLQRGAACLKKKRRPRNGAPQPVERTGPVAAPPPAPVSPPAGPAPAGAAPPAGAPVSQSVATAMAAWMGRSGGPRRPGASGSGRGSSRARSVAFALTLDYRVPNLPMPIKQPSSMVCWATVATMMASWRDQMSHQMTAYIGGLGEPWASKLSQNAGLTPGEAPQLLATMGLQVEAAASFPAQAWEQMLRDYGPLWVTGDNNTQPGIQGAHAHILVGIHGPSDGDPTVDVIDPALGTEVQMPFSALLARYEQLAPTSFAGLQIRHWPAGAQRAAQQSLAWARQAAARLERAQGPAAVVVAAAGLGWQVLKDAAEGSDDLVWTRSRMAGTRIPGDEKSKEGLKAGNYQLRSFKSRQTLRYDEPWPLPDDNLGAEFEVRYSYNGHCIQEVSITNISYAPPAWLSGRKLKVETDIRPEPGYERNDVAALVVEFVYHFTNLRGSQGTFTDRYILFGDGRQEVHTFNKS